MRYKFPLMLALLVPLLSACDETTAPPAPGSVEPGTTWQDRPDAPPTGSEFDDPDFHLEAQSPRRCVSKAPLSPAPHLQRLSIPVVILAKEARSVPVSALSFSLEDKQGHIFRPTLAGCAPALKQSILSKGDQLKGEVAFDVPSDIGHLELIFEPFLIGRPKMRARVEVPALASQ